MPVILSREDEETRLNPDVSEASLLLPLLKPYPSEDMVSHKVDAIPIVVVRHFGVHRIALEEQEVESGEPSR
jgi:putative SOS response-associated peptidase YedK